MEVVWVVCIMEVCMVECTVDSSTTSRKFKMEQLSIQTNNNNLISEEKCSQPSVRQSSV